MACQISLIIPSSLHPFIHPFIHSSLHPFIHSSLHPFIHSSSHPLVPSSLDWLILCFWYWSGAYMGDAQGGLARQSPRPTSTYTTLQLRLKIALVVDAVFLRFWLHLGSQDGLQNRPKSWKNPLRKCTPTSTRFRSDFYRFFLRFSTPWGSKNLAKT